MNRRQFTTALAAPLLAPLVPRDGASVPVIADTVRIYSPDMTAWWEFTRKPPMPLTFRKWNGVWMLGFDDGERVVAVEAHGSVEVP